MKIGIYGVGLIGGSILKKLSKNSNYEIFVYSKSSFKKALKYTNNSSDDINILKNCNLVFVCCSIEQTFNALNSLNDIVNSKCIVVDVASIKKDLLNKKFNYNFILSHPMAGTEKSGFESGQEDLFLRAKWLIEKDNKLLNKIINDLGAIPIKIDMNKHDKLTAQISHLPTLLSFLLFDAASSEAKQIASSGFRDTTRLAMSSPVLTLNMFKNTENILDTFDIIVNKLNEIKNMSDEEKIEYFKLINKKRMAMYDKDGKNIFKI